MEFLDIEIGRKGIPVSNGFHVSFQKVINLPMIFYDQTPECDQTLVESTKTKGAMLRTYHFTHPVRCFNDIQSH